LRNLNGYNKFCPYWEVFTKKKHICPNRSSQSTRPNSTTTATTPTNRSTYYNKIPWSNTTPKPKMSNSFELLTGSINDIQKKYEILSDIVSEYNGKVHGSQSHIVSANTISLIVYFEVSEGQREEVKRKFENLVRNNQVVLQRN
jgi:hypothetical protein